MEKIATVQNTVTETENWWDIFEDDLLSCLEEELLQNSKELETSLYKVIESRALAGEQQSYLYPELSIDPHTVLQVF